MFNVGDLVYLREESVRKNMWLPFSNKPFIILKIGPAPNVITINVEGQTVSVMAAWLEKRTMEGQCIK